MMVWCDTSATFRNTRQKRSISAAGKTLKVVIVENSAMEMSSWEVGPPQHPTQNKGQSNSEYKIAVKVGVKDMAIENSPAASNFCYYL